MKSILLTAVTASLILTACGGSTISVPATTPTTTKYQGVWGWVIGDANGTLIDSGAVIFDDETSGTTGVVAFGAYANQAKTRLGFALMGPVDTSATLDVGFTTDTDTSTPTLFFVGQDSDNAMGTYQGRAAFEGSGAIVDASGNAVQTIVVGLVQTSTTVPTSANAQAAAKQNARAQAVAFASIRPMKALTIKSSPSDLAKNAASVLLNR